MIGTTATALVVVAAFLILTPAGAPAQEAAGSVVEPGGTMINLTPQTIACGALLVPTLALGYWLTATGKPYNQALFTVHKLLPLAAVVLLNFTARQVHTMEPLNGGDVAALVTMNVCFLAAIVTGGLVSLETPMPLAVRWTHRLGPWAATVGSGLLLFTLSRN